MQAFLAELGALGWNQRATRRTVRAALVLALVALTPSSTRAQTCATVVGSLDNQGKQVGTYSFFGEISGDGRFVMFTTGAPLVHEDNDLFADVYVRDRVLGTTELVSVASDGTKGNSNSYSGFLSADGRFATFGSSATNLVPGDTNQVFDVFVHDRLTGQTWRASLGDVGQQANSDCGGGSISADGRFVAFTSLADNLCPNDLNGSYDVFVYDHVTNTSRCVSVNALGQTSNGGGGAPYISANGRYVTFYTVGTDLGACGTPLGDGVVFDMTLGTYTCLAVTPSGNHASAGVAPSGISPDGRFVSFSSSAPDLVPNDTNGIPDAFVRDLVLGVTTRASLSSTGAQANQGSDLVRVSSNGRFVAFECSATNLIPGVGGWNIYVRDTWANTIALASQSTSGVHANDQCLYPEISGDGTVVLFVSDATTLIDGGDANGFASDVLLRVCEPTAPLEYCVSKTNSLNCIPAISSTGTPSASSGQAFDIAASGVINHKPGLLLYSVTGEALIPFEGGFLCVAAPLKRTAAQISSGAPPPIIDCSGAYHYDFNALIQSGKNPALVTGQPVWTQYWSRDSGFAAPNNVGLTDALLFTIQ